MGRELDAINQGLITPEDIKGLSRPQIVGLADIAMKIHRRELAAATANRNASEAAKQQAEKATDTPIKQRLAKRAEVLEQQAKQHEMAAQQKPREFAKAAAKIYRQGEGIRAVHQDADELTVSVKGAPKGVQADDYARRIVNLLDAVFADKPKGIPSELRILAKNKSDLSDHMRGVVYETCRRMIDTITRLMKPFEAEKS
jgi:hypothetical protein